MRKSSISPDVLLAALPERWRPVAEFRPLGDGTESETYRFKNGSRTYVLRANRGAAGFWKDALAHRRFATRSLPIPAVLEVERIDDEHAYCISEYLAGVTLQDLPAADLRYVLAPTADVMIAIAASDVDGLQGFGPFNEFGEGVHNSWRGFLTSIADGNLYDWSAACRYIDHGRIGRFLARLNELAEQCPEIGKLVHGDFGSNNLLTDGRTISGVIDWSEAMLGDPLYDVANLFFWRPWRECMEQQARYFEPGLHGDRAVEERLLCYQLRIGLKEIQEN